MTPGQLARRLLGPRLFPTVGRYYRSWFVDLERVVDSFPPLRPEAHVLEVGGGDGELMNVLLARYPRARATLIDISPTIGGTLRPDLRSRVQLLPGINLAQYTAMGLPPCDLVVVSDVVHHVPPAQRRQFFGDLRKLLAGTPTQLVIKDIRRGTFKGWLAELTDHYVSGDRQARLLTEDELEVLVREAIPEVTARRTALFERDPPNYCMVFSGGAR